MNPGRFSAEGQGWRLAWEADRQPFSVLIGGPGWAAELTAEEARELRGATAALLEQHSRVSDQMMAEEAIILEFERGAWWLALEGDRSTWALRFVLTPAVDRRGIEGSWPEEASASLLQALGQLPL